MKVHRALVVSFLYFLALVCGIPAFAQAPGSADNEAARILESTGISGGVVSHLGCGDGTLTAALYADDRFLVHGLDADAGNVQKARQHIDALGLYGKVSAETYDGENLPYGDSIVNLMVIDGTARVSAAEIERVLVPRGVVVVASDRTLGSVGLTKTGEFGRWTKYTKPWPDDIDQWTHFLYDASGNAVSHDKKVRYPRHTQWYAGPKFSRHHDALASLSAMTSTGGRLFYIYDEGSVSVMHRPPHWKLIARDAFNGKLLWKRDIPTWMTHLYNFRAGPAELPRRLVSVGDHVYCTLAWNAPAVKLDAATGQTLLTYQESKGTEELVFHDGTLLIVTGHPDRHIEISDEATGYWDRTETDLPVLDKSIIACDAASGRLRWRVDGDNLGYLMPLSLCALGKHVFYLDNRELHCLDFETGRQRWAAPFEPPAEGLYVRGYTPTVVAYQDVIMCLTWNRLVAYSIGNGEKLWEHKGAIGYGSAGDLFAIGDKAWTFPMIKGMEMPPRSDYVNQGQTGVGIDIHSGEIVEQLPFARTQHHHRCYRNKATENCFLLGHSGIQVIDLETKQPVTHRWVRGICQYGIMPANGCIYVPPDTCQCYFGGKINGLFALTDASSWAEVEISSALEKGPAYGEVVSDRSSVISGGPTTSLNTDHCSPITGQWPTYRGDTARSGSAGCSVPKEPVEKWRVKVGETPTAPVVAAGSVFLADRDAYTVYCLNADSGRLEWKYFAGGAVDSPPTIYEGYCVFGCRDGSVYCLDAKTGELAWRFRTSKTERRIGWENRLASPWWIHGSVLIAQDTVYLAAGHSSNLDGGIRLYGLDLRTGEQLHFNKLATGHWGSDEGWGYLSDILCSQDGTVIGMRRAGFDMNLQKGGHGPLQTDTALLDASWFHRKQWNHSGKAGKLVVFDGGRTVTADNIYTGLKERRKVTNIRQEGSKWNQVGHLHQKFTRYLEEEWFPVGTHLRATEKGGAANWQQYEDLQPRAMILAADKVCVAGWLDAMVIHLKTGRPKDPAHPDPHDAVLRVYSAADGERLSELRLPADPVFDGLAAAQGRLYVSTQDGMVTCFAGE